MKRLWLAIVFAVGCISSAQAGQLGKLEQFVLAKDKQAFLNKLLPGTRTFYYYSALYYQSQGKLDRVDQLLKAWQKRHRYDSNRTQIEYRQALLRYTTQPKKTLRFLRKKLYLYFNHAPSVRGRKRVYPSLLNPKRYSWPTLMNKTLRRSSYSLYGFEHSALDRLAQSGKLNKRQVLRLLRRIKRPDVPNLMTLVLQQMSMRHGRKFGSVSLHSKLLLEQLMLLQKEYPSLLNNRRFIRTVLRKMIPSSQAWKYNARAKRAYLNRLWGFVQHLAANRNSLKLNVLYHILKLDQSEGTYDVKRFLKYIRIPRYANYSQTQVLQQRYNKARLYRSFTSITGLSRIGSDKALVNDYLSHFFVKAKDYKAYSNYIKPSYLKRIFAETKLLYGIGPAQQWYSLLPAAQYKALQERVEVRFRPQNKRYFAPNESIQLRVALKNVRTLFVKVYRVNTFNYYKKYKRAVQLGMDLDGLIANKEYTYTYSNAPVRRIERTFKFPELKQRGTYIVDFIGNGKSSRALIRKGQLRYIAQTTAAGQRLTVLNASKKIIQNAAIWMNGKQYKAQPKTGYIYLPFAKQRQHTNLILEDNGFYSLARLGRAVEKYTFNAGIHVDQESLLTRNKAKIWVRPSLFISTRMTSMRFLKTSSLTITATDRFGVRSTQTAPSFKLHDGRESIHTFTVPKNLSKLTVRLDVSLKKLSTGKKQSFSSSRTFFVNQIDKKFAVHTFHLRTVQGQYILELLDKTGVPKAFHTVSLRMKHKDIRRSQSFGNLQTDANGRIQLGHLKDIRWLTARTRGKNKVYRKWYIERSKRTLPATLHGHAGQKLYVPYMGQAQTVSKMYFSLLETRRGQFIKDYSTALQVKDGHLIVGPLPTGTYSLRLKEHARTIHIAIEQGPIVRGTVQGQYKQLQISKRTPVHVQSVQKHLKELKIQLSNATRSTRVHVIATRYVPRYSIYQNLLQSHSTALGSSHTVPECSQYQMGRKIGDEYRYILERRNAVKYPGNMLERPSLLLHPWARRKTQTGRKTGSEGTRFGGSGYGGGGYGGRGGLHLKDRKKRGYGYHNLNPNLNFLPQGSAVYTNLRPNREGTVSLALKGLQKHPHIHVLVVDQAATIYTQLSLKDQSVKFRDQRLISALQPNKHYIQKRQISILKKGQPFVIQDVTSSTFQKYDSLARIYKLLSTIRSDAKFKAFRFVLKWPTLTLKQKLSYYSKYASHELNLFLYKKDDDFFVRYILPSLRNKKDKTFIDHFLLGTDLVRYLQPWRFQKLNVVERIFLAQRFKKERPRVARYIRELNTMVPISTPHRNRLFEFALQASSLSSKISPIMDRIRSIRNHSRSRLLRGFLGTKSAPVPAPSMATAKPYLKKERRKKYRPRRARRAFKSKRRSSFKKNDDKDDDASMDFKSIQQARQRMQKTYYRVLEKTQEWAENNYYKLHFGQQNARLIKINDFWSDYAAYSGFGNFFSRHVAQASRNFTEMMLALTVLDLPFKSQKHGYTFKGSALTLKPKQPMLLFHKQIVPSPKAQKNGSILVSQRYFLAAQPYRYVRGKRVEQWIQDEFLVQTIYGVQVVISNPSSSSKKLDVLMQIPKGAMPVGNGRVTQSLHIQLAPYQTRRLKYFFYFPVAGTFSHFAAHVSSQGKLITWTDSKKLKAVTRPTKINRTTWEYISQNGTLQDVLNYIQKHNIFRIQLGRIAWRMKNKKAYQQIHAVLKKRYVYNTLLASYSVYHKDIPGIREFIQHKTYFVRRLGAYFQSPLLRIDPIVRRWYEHLEYSPLVNARAHKLGRRRTINNHRFAWQYKRLLNILKYKANWSADDAMAMVYYTLLQDRIALALRIFKTVRPEQLQTRLQYDYFAAYLGMYTSDLKQARTIASRYTRYPLLRWRARFAAVLAQLDEISGKKTKPKATQTRTQRTTQLAAAEPSFDFKVEARKVSISYRNIRTFKVRYYLMDIELLFSKNPFLKKHTGHFSMIQPNATTQIKTASKQKGTLTFALPKKFHSSNVMIEIIGGDIQKSTAYYANTLDVHISRKFGQLQVTHSKSNKRLAQVYIKVYAKKKDGRVQFYKDGYTDLRGRFDYAALSTNDLTHVRRFSILILSAKDGAVVREVAPPKP